MSEMATFDPKADQVGSLTRPDELLVARANYRRGKIDRSSLSDLEDHLIVEALERQRDLGMEVLTDGEFRRDAWQTDVTYALEGFSPEWPIVRNTLPDGSVVELEMHTKPLVGRLRKVRRITEHESAFLLAHAGGPVKITMPSPHTTAWGSYQEGVSDKVYASREEVFGDLIPIYQDEIRALVSEGVAYVQLDEGFTRYGRPEAREAMKSAGDDPEALLSRDIEVENACYAAAKGADVVLGSHLCRGSRTASRGNGDYEWLAERLFGELDVDRFLFEYDSEAVGGFEPLRFLPKGKTVVLGLVTSKDASIEDQDDLIRKIEQAAKFCSVEQLAISPQCGFGGSADNHFMTVEEQWTKLENMVETARRVWG
jgi:5-methyltetrahydropteroyltriglutamate--homocysteine methyltransferase